MKKKLACLLCLLPLCLTGCLKSSMADLVKQASGDKASWIIRVNTIYGTATYSRVGEMGTNQTATLTPEGSLKIESK